MLTSADLQNSATVGDETNPYAQMQGLQANMDEATGHNDFEGRYSHMRDDLLDEAAKDLRA